MMKWRYNIIILKYFIILVCFSIIIALDSESFGEIFKWELLKVRMDLKLDIPATETSSDVIYLPEDINKILENNVTNPDVDDKEKASKWNELDFRYFTLYLSHLPFDYINSQAARVKDDEINKLQMIKSLPFMFQNSSYRVTLESFGKIIEPQIKIGICF